MIADIPTRGNFRYSDTVRASSIQILEPSMFDRALATAAGRNGLAMHFDPADFSGGTALDRASLATWNTTASGSADAVLSDINGKPALAFTRGTSRLIQSSVARANGSFSIMLVRQQTADEAAVAAAVMFGSGPSLDNLIHARQVSGSMRWFPNTSTPGVPSIYADGTFLETFTYDAETQLGSILSSTGGLIGQGGFGSPPATGYPLEIGGWNFGYGFPGKIGRVLVFDRDLSAASEAGNLSGILDLMRAEYAL